MCSCDVSDTEDWQKITVKNDGTLKIPQGWSYLNKDGIHYVMDDKDNPVLISYKENERNDSLFFEEMEYVDFNSSEVYSNGAIFGEAVYSYDDEKAEHFYLWTGNTNFVVWSNEISFDYLKKIAKTYEAFH